jgi:hypothetical protein
MQPIQILIVRLLEYFAIFGRNNRFSECTRIFFDLKIHVSTTSLKSLFEIFGLSNVTSYPVEAHRALH